MSSQTVADAADLVNEGAAHHGRNDFDKAERCYREALIADPGNADANNLLGVLLAGRKRLGLAAHHLRLAVAARPAEASFRNNLGNALVSATEYPEAIRHLEEAVRLEPRMPRPIAISARPMAARAALATRAGSSSARLRSILAIPAPGSSSPAWKRTLAIQTAPWPPFAGFSRPRPAMCHCL